jgi:hypothetical protein
MEEMKEVTDEKCDCPHCKKRAQREKEYNEMAFAVLLAIIPMLVLTLFGQIGLF